MERHPVSHLEELALSLAESAYGQIDRKYGSAGYRPKPYHNAQHAKDVVAASEAIADEAIKTGKLEPRNKALLIIAAAYHDCEQDLGSGENEEASASQACMAMAETDQFSQEDMAAVRSAIMGTVVHFEDGSIVQSGGDLLAQILADSDLSSLGSDEERYWDRSLKLFNELHPDGEGMPSFLDLQQKLLASHNYFTAEARALFSNQEANLAFTRARAAATGQGAT